jgi:hypothetical protein
VCLKQSISQGNRNSEKLLRTEVKEHRAKIEKKRELQRHRRLEVESRRSSSILSIIER